MHLAVDVYYAADSARGAGVAFARLQDEGPAFVVIEEFAGAPGEYEPGDFKKRELPYLLKLVELARAQGASIETILVDGYVWLEDGRAGLGAHLFEALGSSVPIIGVAKTRFHSASAIEVLRGQSQSPLFITATGMDAQQAADFVTALHGGHRLPTMLRIVDHASRGLPI
jgi:deoxyribonuclease V